MSFFSNIRDAFVRTFQPKKWAKEQEEKRLRQEELERIAKEELKLPVLKEVPEEAKERIKELQTITPEEQKEQETVKEKIEGEEEREETGKRARRYKEYSADDFKELMTAPTGAESITRFEEKITTLNQRPLQHNIEYTGMGDLNSINAYMQSIITARHIIVDNELAAVVVENREKLRHRFQTIVQIYGNGEEVLDILYPATLLEEVHGNLGIEEGDELTMSSLIKTIQEISSPIEQKSGARARIVPKTATKDKMKVTNIKYYSDFS